MPIRVGELYFLMPNMHNQNPFIPLNRNISIECTVLKHILSLATETKIGALFINSKKATVYRMTLE